MRIRTVAILGVGAVGSYFVWGLQEKLGSDLWVIAEDSRRDRLEREGLIINDRRYSLHVRTPQEAKGVDLLLVATKYGALEGALEAISAMVDSHTVVMSLLNGVNSEEIIGRRIGMEHMVYSLMKIASERVENRVAFDGEVTPGLFYGEPGAKPGERISALEALWEGTPLHHHVCEDIIHEMWCKFAHNVSCNLPQAILNCGVGAYGDSPYAAAIVRRLREEVVAVAAAKGIDISGPDALLGQKGSAAKQARYSTLQDLDAGRHTEVDIFAGAVMQMGQELGIATPYCEFAYNAIKVLEEKNDGKFQYE